MNIFDKFHEWLKTQEFHLCYPNEYKVIDYAQINPEVRIKGLSSSNVYNNAHAQVNACNFYAKYEEYRDKVIRRREFWSLCRIWRAEYGSSWKRLYREGFYAGRYLSGPWIPLLISPQSNAPYDIGFAQGRNQTVLERR